MIELILSIIAPFLFAIFSIPNLIVILIKNYKTHGFYKVVSEYFLGSAINVDKFGNKNLAPLFNATLRRERGYRFGEEDETISSVLGKNQRDKTLTIAGWATAIILIVLDYSTWRKGGHCIASIKE